MKLMLQLLACVIPLAGFASEPPVQPVNPIDYRQDWEASQNEVFLNWRGYVDNLGPDCATYQYGFVYLIFGSGWALTVDGAESKVLRFSNNIETNGAWGPDDLDCLQANLFREHIIDADNAGTYIFEYLTEFPEESDNTPIGFVQVLDQLNSYTAVLEHELAAAEGKQTIQFTLDYSLVGKILQVGFRTTSFRQDNSIMMYDNVVLRGLYSVPPQRPEITSTESGDGIIQIVVSVSEDGASEATEYAGSCTDGIETFASTSNTPELVITGLTNGTSYTCTATASNVWGTSSISEPTESITLEALPTGLPIWLLYEATK